MLFMFHAFQDGSYFSNSLFFWRLFYLFSCFSLLMFFLFFVPVLLFTFHSFILVYGFCCFKFFPRALFLSKVARNAVFTCSERT